MTATNVIAGADYGWTAATPLDPSATWTATCSLVDKNSRASVGSIAVTMALVSGVWQMTMAATNAQTASWLASGQQERFVEGDVKFVSGATPAIIQRTGRFELAVVAPVTA